MIPYGKDSWRRNSDTARGEWLAARGFALCRLDVRGTGSSPGVALDEYTEAETRDGYDAVEWLAAQPWCNGNVGMWGISYGGFTAIQVAKLRPPHLRAILPDVRHRRPLPRRRPHPGRLRHGEREEPVRRQPAGHERHAALPALPRATRGGTSGARAWRPRRRGSWPGSATRPTGRTGAGGSLAPDYDALECAVFQVAGWTDAYIDPVFRMQQHCRNAAVRTLVGNWVHSFPDDAYPGPNLDWLHEMVRFFDRYLKGIPNGWEDEPALVWFEREYADPEPFPAAWPGRWRAAAAFPVPGTRAVGAAPGRRDPDRRAGARDRHGSPPPSRDGGDVRPAVLGRRLASQRPRARPSP